jgi:hypothetical protein
LQVAPEVAAVMPPEALARFEHDPDYEDLNCICGKPIAAGEPAAVVVLRDPVLDFWHVSAAHPECQASAVIEADLSHLALPADGHDIVLHAGLIRPQSRAVRRSPRPTPSLTVGTTMSLPTNTDAGELADLLMQSALGDGLGLVAAIRPELDPPAHGGWSAAVAPLGSGRYAAHVQAPSGLALAREAVFEAPRAWEDAARHLGGLNLYVGTLMHRDLQVEGALEQLAAAGRLAGGRIPVSFLAV